MRKFMLIVCAAFLTRQKPVSTIAKPHCMNMTRNPAIRVHTVVGASLPPVAALTVSEGAWAAPAGAAWALRGVTSNRRYTTRQEQNALVAIQATLGREQATCAALIPIRKSAAWWDLAQDERRA